MKFNDVSNVSDWFDNYWLDKHLKKFSHEDLQELIPFRDFLFKLQQEYEAFEARHSKLKEKI